MHNPITSQITSRYQVSTSSEAIIARHTRMPSTGTSGTSGVRYGRGRSGRRVDLVIDTVEPLVHARVGMADGPLGAGDGCENSRLRRVEAPVNGGCVAVAEIVEALDVR